MKGIGRVRLVALTAAFALIGIAAALPLAASAQGPSSVLVQAYICPQEYAGPNWALDCDPLPDVDASVYIDASEYGFTETTDANGQASFTIEGVGPFVVELGVPGDFAGFFSLCGEVGGTEPRQVEGADTNRIILPVQGDEELYCSFYVSPVDSRGEIPIEPVNGLPDSGAGSMVSGDSGLVKVVLLLGGAVLLAGLGLLTAREELFERQTVEAARRQGSEATRS
jgi:hypothetical protein